MNIIFLDAVQDYGGSQKSTISLMRNIKKEHNTLFIDFWGTEDLLFEELEKNNINYKILDKRDSAIIINESRGAIKKTRNLIRYGINIIKLKKELDKIIIGFSPDLIVVNNVKSLSVINKRNFKVVFFVRTWFANNRINKTTNRLLNRIDYFFAVSNATKNAIYIKRNIDLNKIFVLQNSIVLDKPYRPRSINKKTINIINIGGYLHTKGLHLTLEIARKLKERKIDFHIDIIGALYKAEHSKKYYKSLKEYIDKNNLSKHVVLHQNIKDMSSFYDKADILIHPTYTEGLPRVIMEAMSNSIPVISNPVGGVNDFVIDRYTGLLTKFNNIDDFVESIVLLAENSDLYNYISYNAYNMIRSSFNPEIQTKRLNKILNEIQ